jgi:hypothetical protein
MANKVRCSITGSFDDNSIELNIRMDGFPKDATDYIRHNHEDFIRGLQEAIIHLLGSKITQVDVYGVLTSNDKPIQQEAIDALQKSLREKDSSLN